MVSENEKFKDILDVLASFTWVRRLSETLGSMSRISFFAQNSEVSSSLSWAKTQIDTHEENIKSFVRRVGASYMAALAIVCCCFIVYDRYNRPSLRNIEPSSSLELGESADRLIGNNESGNSRD